MEAIKTRFNAITIILLSVFAILGCSKDDPDYYCDYNFVVTISPEGSGNVSECNRCGPDNEYIILTATPNQGYEFKEWIKDDGTKDIINPLRIFNKWCDEKGATIRITAVFEQIEE